MLTAACLGTERNSTNCDTDKLWIDVYFCVNVSFGAIPPPESLELECASKQTSPRI